MQINFSNLFFLLKTVVVIVAISKHISDVSLWKRYGYWLFLVFDTLQFGWKCMQSGLMPHWLGSASVTWLQKWYSGVNEQVKKTFHKMVLTAEGPRAYNSLVVLFSTICHSFTCVLSYMAKIEFLFVIIRTYQLIAIMLIKSFTQAWKFFDREIPDDIE